MGWGVCMVEFYDCSEVSLLQHLQWSTGHGMEDNGRQKFIVEGSCIMQDRWP